MAFSERDVEAIDEAIASGELKVVVDGREVQYRSIDELMKARRFIKSRVDGSKGSSPFAGFRVVIDRGIR